MLRAGPLFTNPSSDRNPGRCRSGGHDVPLFRYVGPSVDSAKVRNLETVLAV